MHKHEIGKTRITIERISVTTVRQHGAVQPVYREILRELIEPKTEPLLLTSGCSTDAEVAEAKQIKP